MKDVLSFGGDTCAQSRSWEATCLSAVTSRCFRSGARERWYHQQAGTRAGCTRSAVCLYLKGIKFALCSSLLTSVVFCLLSFLSSHSRCFLTKCKGNRVGKGALFFSSDGRTAAVAHRNSGVVTHRHYSSNRWPMKEKAPRSHTGV